VSTQTAQQFLLPDVGEGLTEAEVVAWHVAVGDTVEVNQVIVDIETAKSVVELPSPYAGTVVELLVAAGETVAVGTPIISIGGEAEQEEPKLLVGYGAREDQRPRRRRGAAARPGEPAEAPTRPRAKPPVRKLASVLGVDLASLTPSGPDGIVLRTDVLAATPEPEPEPEPQPVEEPKGATNEQRIPIKGVRKHTAAAMVASAFTAPHVTEFVEVDVTATLALREQVLARRGFRDVKATPLAFVARAYLHALRRTPMAVARWDEAAQEIVVPAQVNLGIAAATPRGLMVPNIKAADRLDLRELALAIDALATTAKAGKTPPEDLAGGGTTITNIGVFGVETGTPILNPGEAGILALGAAQRRPWEFEGGIALRQVLTLSLSFDHRVVDGAQGSRFLAEVGGMLAAPDEALLLG
jgi:2-oxoisovalerate dehydrogenase E2 component (dihydrolipoyl transacylase)